MKNKALSLVSIVLSVWLISCGDSESDQSLKIEGSWKLQTNERYNCDDPTSNGTLTCGTYFWCNTFTFNADKTFTSKNTSTGVSGGAGTFSIVNGKDLMLQYNNNPSPTILIMTLSGNTLILTNESDFAACYSKDTYIKI
jgi:hypothetical protein